MVHFCIPREIVLVEGLRRVSKCTQEKFRAEVTSPDARASGIGYCRSPTPPTLLGRQPRSIDKPIIDRFLSKGMTPWHMIDRTGRVVCIHEVQVNPVLPLNTRS